jgi:C4-dicarboxylate-specific signal transduction histidine kinase
MKTQEQIQQKISELEEKRKIFSQFLCDIYGEEVVASKINENLWKIDKEIALLNWVIGDELPF